jgi:hypothetical protein
MTKHPFANLQFDHVHLFVLQEAEEGSNAAGETADHGRRGRT